jgi:PAS domain S-box-containing protein/diguanylate cyclase (GGDEF)-like protein
MAESPDLQDVDETEPTGMATIRLDLGGFVTEWSAEAEALFGFSAEEVTGQSLRFLNLNEAEDMAELGGLPPGTDQVSTVVFRRTRRGHPAKARMTLALERDASGEPLSLLATYRPLPIDIGPEVRLRLYASIIEDSSQGILVTDATGHIVMVNRAFSEITGYLAEEALGRTPDLLRSGRHDADFRERVQSAMRGNGIWVGEILGRRKNGEVFPQSVFISSVRNDQGEVSHSFSIFSDISQHQETEQRLQRLANFDHATKLPNRLLLGQLMNQALAQARRSHECGAVFVVQLHRVNWVYDTLGHELGDSYMAQAAQRLQQGLRDQDILARLGHDKLAVTLINLRHQEHAAVVAQKLLSQLHAPLSLLGQEVGLPASIGIALYPDNGMEAGSLLRYAEMASLKVGTEQEPPLVFFSDEMNHKAKERFRLEGELRRAIGQGELELYHQPTVSLRNGRIVGAEALLRWQHPRHGLLTPGHFVPLAEDTSLILELGHWVLAEACRQIMVWQGAGMDMPPLAVNLSARQFDRHLPRRIDELLTTYRIAPQHLKLEITESLMVRNPDEVVHIMNDLSAMGLGIALDDFGTGYSSLAYLKRFPITTLKIDRSFVTGVPHQPNDCAIAQAIVTMGKQLRQEIVAEGVENKAQMDYLRELGCDQLQGYLFSKPLSAADYERLVRDDVRLTL